MQSTAKTTRYSIVGVRNMIAQLEAWIEQSEETLGNAEDAGNDERVDMLETRIAALEAARDELDAIE